MVEKAPHIRFSHLPRFTRKKNINILSYFFFSEQACEKPKTTASFFFFFGVVGLVGNLTVLGDVASLTAIVTSLGELVGGLVTVLRDMTVLATGVTLHGTGLAVLGKVVRATTLVARGALGTETGLSGRRGTSRGTSLSGSSSRSSTGGGLVLWALSRDVAELGTVVTLGTLGTVRAVALNVTNVTTGVTLLRSSGLWLRTSRGLVARLTAVVAQSFGLLAVVSDVAGLAALVTGFREHIWWLCVFLEDV